MPMQSNDSPSPSPERSPRPRPRHSPSEADRDRDSLAGLLSNLTIEKSAHQLLLQQQRQTFSPPHPRLDLPLPSGTLFPSNGNSYSDGNNSNVTLTPSLKMSHEQEQQQNQDRQSHHEIMSKLSPTCVRTVSHKKSAAGSGGSSGIPHLPLPFSARPKPNEVAANANAQSSST